MCGEYYEEEFEMDSKEKLDKAFDGVMEAFDRWDAAADRLERKLKMMPFVMVGLTVGMILLSRAFV